MEIIEFKPRNMTNHTISKSSKKQNKLTRARQMEELQDILTEIPKEMFSLAERDFILTRVDNEIKAKRELLLKKREYLHKVSHQNQFLKQVAHDYHKYYNYIIEQKREQTRALETLHQYLEHLIKTEKLTQENLRDAKKDQKHIIEEVKKIKGELDSLVPMEK